MTGVTAALLVLLAPRPGAAQAAGAHSKPPEPNVHGGGAKPSSIPNDATTEVTLPGFHLTGAHLESGSICKIVSYQVVSDNLIKMMVKGVETVEDKDDTCTLTVRTPGGSASTWIVVELTQAQQQEQAERQKTEGMAKAQAFWMRTGKVWRLHFANGANVTYTTTGHNGDDAPTFQSSTGSTVKIMVSDSNDATIIESGCIRTGKVVGAEVKTGQSMGQCTPAGSWSATLER